MVDLAVMLSIDTLAPKLCWLPSVFDTVGWVIWPVENVPEMTYNVSSGTLSFYSLTHSLQNCEMLRVRAWLADAVQYRHVAHE